MTVPWCRLDGGFCTSPLPGALAQEFRHINDLEAAGMIAKLWSWCTIHAPNGDLTLVSVEALAMACGWVMGGGMVATADHLYEALRDSGVIYETGDDRVLLHCPKVTAAYAAAPTND